jgi:hypothetical protein
MKSPVRKHKGPKPKPANDNSNLRDRLYVARIGWRETLLGAIGWGAAMALSAQASLWLSNAALTSHYWSLTALIFAGAALAWPLSLSAFRFLAFGRGREPAFAAALLCLIVFTIGVTAVLFAIIYDTPLLPSGNGRRLVARIQVPHLVRDRGPRLRRAGRAWRDPQGERGGRLGQGAAWTFDVDRIDEIERETKHDVIAFLTHLAEIVGPDARFVHQGMTSSDVLDTCFNVQLVRAADLLLPGHRRASGRPQAPRDSSTRTRHHRPVARHPRRAGHHSA